MRKMSLNRFVENIIWLQGARGIYMSFMYYLPDENGKGQEYCTSANAVIIIGANGSGKSKLGAWIEQQSMQDVHRIGAQRKLNFSENIP